MFSKRFDQVYEDTKNIWHSQQYSFTYEYFKRSPFFPPISFIVDTYHLCRTIVFSIRRACWKKPADCPARVFEIIPKTKKLIKDWHEFEGATTYEYAHTEAKGSKSTSIKSNQDANFDNTENLKDSNVTKNASNKLTTNLQQMQDDLTKLSQSSEESVRQMQNNLAQLNQSLEEIKLKLSSNT